VLLLRCRGPHGFAPQALGGVSREGGQNSFVDVIDGTGRGDLVDEAARIWAEATAARDGDGEVPGLEVARPVIQGVLDRSPQALLLIAFSADGTAAGFAVVEPLAGRTLAGWTSAGRDEPAAQVSYLGVRPRLWGRGVGERLLQEVRRRLTVAGYAHAELLVYDDNRRAIALYERLGWRPHGLPTAHPRTGKPEQRYELRL
jgi:ribosomal protein S18 acetylase RimI-like enzyme